MKISIRTDVKLDGGLRRIIKKTVKTASRLHGRNEEVSVLITTDEIIKGLNNDFRGIDRPTDVLSFPSDEEGFLGDFAISLCRAKEQAKEYGHSLEREITFLCAHAMLHLCGFDHEDEESEKAMRQEQRKILKETGYDIREI